jgi:hypothetical protein
VASTIRPSKVSNPKVLSNCIGFEDNGVNSDVNLEFISDIIG